MHVSGGWFSEGALCHCAVVCVTAACDMSRRQLTVQWVNMDAIQNPRKQWAPVALVSPVMSDSCCVTVG